ncbi:hypothetical protein EDF74_0767 [Stenotrophomonas rhizophila]|uniref:hypothetical protein n=1 Tax=Stenotrophomonas rhizophila TaxID=216778 RepID=UPI000F4BB0A6|nr:hypothetical protein [Stenotrophomonas rhizophila]ROP79710.1 hypothetical protein EDF74_0767 [Stenotrophomonas rhizophila]
MRSTEETILTVAGIVIDSMSMNEAALSGDFDDARFRAELIVAKADASGHQDVVLAAAFVMDRLGPLGSVPRSGFAEGMLRVAEELDKIGVQPL